MKLLPGSLATALLLAPLALVTPAYAVTASDPAYSALTAADIGDDTGDAPSGSDLTRSEVEIDPNYGHVYTWAHLRGYASGRLRLSIAELGAKDDSGTCVPQVEVVVSNVLVYDNSDIVVRRAGGTELPVTEGEIVTGDTFGVLKYQPLLDGFVPDCGQVRLTSGSGVTLDTAPLTFTHTPAKRAKLTAYWEYGEHAEQLPVGYPSRFDLSIGTADPAYGGKIAVTVPPGVTYKPAAGASGRTEYDGTWNDFAFTLTPTESGWKRIRVRITADNADPLTLTFDVYGSGGQPPVATGNLAGRRLAQVESYYSQENGESYQRRSALWFLDRKFAYVGVPPRGKPTCTDAQVKPSSRVGCKRYWWNKETNTLQIGKRGGRVRSGSVYFDRGTYDHRFGFAVAGKRYDRTLLDDVGTSMMSGKVRLRLNRDGTFQLTTWDINGGNPHRARGRYAIGRSGRITLRYRSGKVQVRTFGVAVNRNGELDAGRGVLLSLPGHDLNDMAWLDQDGPFR